VILPMVLHHAAGSLPIVTDCDSVRAEFQRPAKALRWDHLWAGIWKEVHLLGVGHETRFTSVKHIRSHQSLAGAEPADAVGIFGNDRADVYAKLAAGRYVPQGLADDWAAQGAAAVAALRGIAIVLEGWPPCRDLYGKLERLGGDGQPKGPVPPAGPRHEFTWRPDGAWQCATCFLVVRTEKARKRRAKQSCQTHVGGVHDVLSNPRGHALWAARTARRARVVICATCGRHAEGRVDLLRGPCLGAAGTIASARALGRFFGQGLHPDPRQGRLLLEEPAPAAPLVQAWASRAGTAHGAAPAEAGAAAAAQPPAAEPEPEQARPDRLDCGDIDSQAEEPSDGEAAFGGGATGPLPDVVGGIGPPDDEVDV